jgi:hypothetical protein
MDARRDDAGPRSQPRRVNRWGAVAVTGLVCAGLLGACSGGGGTATSTVATGVGSASSVTAAPETNTPGDIPDTVAYIPYANAAGGYAFNHPEGWTQTTQGTSVTFTDKYNGVSAGVLPGAAVPTVASVQTTDIPQLQASEPAFGLTSVSAVALPAGSGVVIVYRRNSPPDPVTGRSVRQEVHRFEIFGTTREVALDLYGAVGADNVDPYTRMSQSLRLS